MYMKIIRNLCFLILLASVCCSYTVRSIGNRSLKRAAKQCNMSVIATGHDTIGDWKVPNLRFEFQGQVEPERALCQFASIYWEVMQRTEPSTPGRTAQEIAMPNGKAGASIMISYANGRYSSHVYKPYTSMVFNLDDGRVLVSGMNRQTDKFEILTESTLAELFGFADPATAEEMKGCVTETQIGSPQHCE